MCFSFSFSSAFKKYFISLFSITWLFTVKEEVNEYLYLIHLALLIVTQYLCEAGEALSEFQGAHEILGERGLFTSSLRP